MEWKEVRLGELGIIKTGKTPRTSIPENYGGDIPFLSPSDDMSNKTAPKTAKNLTLQGLNEVKNCLLPPRSVCVSCIGSDLGKVVLTDRPLVTNQQINSIIPNENVDADYVYYLMTIVGKDLNYISKSSTAVPIINKSTFSNWEIKIPESPNTQRRIASILSSLDSKIETNNKINAKLEEMAQALFKSWFVDFEPFKDGKFVESELGMIPERWKVESISDIPHILETGKRPKGGVGNITKGVPSVGADNVKGLGVFDYSKVKYITEEFADGVKRGWIKGYELLIYKDGGTPGNYIPHFSIMGEGFPFDRFCLNEHVFKLDFYDKIYNLFSYFYFQTPQILQFLKAVGGKAAIPGINQSNVECLKIVAPNEDIQKWGEITLPMITKILQNCNENRKLSQLRDTLLPKLMNGEIEI